MNENKSYPVKIRKNDKNWPFCARTPHNFYHMHFIDLQLVASFSSQFFLSDKYPLNMIYCNSIFTSAIVFEKFTARIFIKESAPVSI